MTRQMLWNWHSCLERMVTLDTNLEIHLSIRSFQGVCSGTECGVVFPTVI